MTEIRPCLAEVGLPNRSRHLLSLTGISPSFSYIDELSPQRLVILEPRSPKNYYAPNYDKYLEELRAHSIKVDFADIYDQAPAFWTNLSCSFLGLENVLNDVYYKGEKNLKALARNAAQAVIPSGFGFVYDSIPVPGNLYMYSGLKRELKRAGFKVVIDDMNERDFKDTQVSIEKSPRTWKDRMNLLAVGLCQLDSLDGPLTDALESRNHGHWLVFQKLSKSLSQIVM